MQQQQGGVQIPLASNPASGAASPNMPDASPIGSVYLTPGATKIVKGVELHEGALAQGEVVMIDGKYYKVEKEGDGGGASGGIEVGGEGNAEAIDCGVTDAATCRSKELDDVQTAVDANDVGSKAGDVTMTSKVDVAEAAAGILQQANAADASGS